MEDLSIRFGFHPADEDKGRKHDMARQTCQDAAEYFDDTLPDGREKSLVLTKLEEAMFWANAAIARNGK